MHRLNALGANGAQRLQPALLPRRALLHQIVAVSDAVVISAAFVIAWWLVATVWFPHPAPLTPHFWLPCMIVPTWLLTLHYLGLYDFSRFEQTRTLVGSLVRVQIVAGLLLLSAMYMANTSWVSRVLMQSFLATSFLMMVGHRLTVRRLLNRYRSRAGFHRPRILMISTPLDAPHYLSLTRNDAAMTAQIAGALLPDGALYETSPVGVPVLGTFGDLHRILREHVIDEIVVTARLDRDSLDRLAASCAVRGLVMRLMVDVPRTSVGTWHADDLGRGGLMLTLSAVPHDPLALAAKRFLDIAGSVAGLFLCTVAWAIYASRIRRETGSSVLFPQVRVGRNGRRFVLYKFRTMHRDAEQRLDELRGRNHMRGPMFKLSNDPRVTQTGRRLRQRHLDELPQFWNALRGEMSLVGTRPPTEGEVEDYREHHLRRLSMKPGITGLWQVLGNTNVNDFEDIVRLDCEYIDNWSLGLDLRILFRTVKKILRADAW